MAADEAGMDGKEDAAAVASAIIGVADGVAEAAAAVAVAGLGGASAETSKFRIC